MLEDVRAWLEEVPDPEIPILSIMDLGIVRDAVWQGEQLQVTITPTYSACPAMAVIAHDIEAALHAHGVEQVCVRQRLDPPWSTDWMSARGREALQRHGIAPPAALIGIAARIRCPHCGSAATECVSAFGSTPCKALYRCRACREPFDYFKRLA